MSEDISDAKLNEFDKSEWRWVARAVRPDLTDEQFDTMWAGFVEMKRHRDTSP